MHNYKDMKYVPVLRYRSEEKEALKSVKLSGKIMPLIEIMKEMQDGNFANQYLMEFQNIRIPFLIDFPLYFILNNSTDKKIQKFLGNIKNNPDIRIDYFEQLKPNKYFIPVISYDSETKYVPISYKKDAIRLRRCFSKLGFRIFKTEDFNNVLRDIEAVIQKDDILLFDIDSKKHNQKDLLKKHYFELSNLKSLKKCKTVIIRSAINTQVKYNQLMDDRIVKNVDNSLLKTYNAYGFDAFGDFAGIRKDRQINEKFGAKEASPGFLFYSWFDNNFYGYKGRIPDFKEYLDHIRPTVMKSQVWNKYSTNHHNSCPGCENIANNNYKSYAYWKRYSIQHYLYTMEEYL